MVVKRKLFEKLKEQSKYRKITLLIGARQVGKTTLLKELFQELSMSKKCLFLDIDILSNYEKVSSFENLLTTIKLSGYEENQKDFFYLFLDEFQKYPSLTKVMKNVYDNLLNIKIYASGSSSLTIKNQAQESLAGRKEIIEIFPLDFEEFLIFKGKNSLVENLGNIKKLSGGDLMHSLNEYYILLEEFMVFGGYPEVVLKYSKEEKQKVLEQKEKEFIHVLSPYKLDNEEKNPVVVWSDPHDYITPNLPAFTRHFTLYAWAGMMALMSDSEIRERYLISEYFNNPTVENLKESDNMGLYLGRGDFPHKAKTMEREIKVCRTLFFWDKNKDW